MFEIGTKIRLVASSCQKTTGPRRGSLAYISRVINPIAYREHKMVVCSVSAVFYRFGFEQKTRVEQQDFVAVFPMVSGSNGDIYPQIEESVKLINGEQGHDWADALKSFYSLPKKAAVAIAVPVESNESSLMDCEDNEYRAMIAAYTMSDDFQIYIHKALMSGHFTKAKDTNLGLVGNWHNLQTMAADRRFRFQMLREWLAKPHRRKEELTLIRMVVAMMQRKRFSTFLTNVNSSLGSIATAKTSSAEIGISLAYDSLTKVLFNKPVVRQLKLDWAKGGNKRILAFLEDVESTWGTLLVLSDRLKRMHS